MRDAKDAVDDAKLEIAIAEKEKEISAIEDLIDVQEKIIDQKEDQIELIQKEIDALNDQKEIIQEMQEASNEYYEKLIKQQEKYYDSLIRNAEMQKSKWEELAAIQEIAEAYSAVEQVFGELGYSVEDVLNGSAGAFEDFKAKFIELTSSLNPNESFTEGLKYALGVEDGTFDTFIGKTEEAGQGLDNLSSKGDNLSTVSDGMDTISTSATTLATNTEGLDENLSGITDSLTNLPTSENLNGWVDGFGELAKAIEGVAEALGIAEEDSVNSLVEALNSISAVSLGSEEEGIIGQFNVLKKAVDGVTASISGCTSGGSEGDASNSKSSSMSAGATDGGGEDNLIGSIENMGTKTAETLGENSDAENGVIGKFNALKQAVTNVTTALGTSEEETDPPSLINALQKQYETAGAILPEEKSLFEELLAIIEACVTALDKMVTTMMTMPEISASSGKNSLFSFLHANGTVGKAFAKGTGKYKGLAHDEKLAVRSEYGQPETTIYPDGTVELTTEPTASSLPKDTVILNEEQTNKMLNNKGTVLGKAHANGTIDVPVNLPSYLRPLQEGDKMYDLIKKLETNNELIQSKIIPPVNSIQKNIDMVTRNISNVNNIKNTNNIPTINVNNPKFECTGVTGEQVLHQIEGQFQGIFLNAYQKAMRH